MSKLVHVRETKRFGILDFKALDAAQGTFSGYLAVFNNVDQGDDVIEPGAFAKTIAERKAYAAKRNTPYLLPICWNHDMDLALGGFTVLLEDTTGLYVEGKLDLNVQRAAEIYSGLVEGYIRDLSVGYIALQRKYIAGIRHLLEMRLLEGSVVLEGMNPDAIIEEVKAASGSTSWPLAPRTQTWDNGAATKAIEAWANGDASKLASVHFWKDPNKDGTEIGAYKLLFCTVDGGHVEAVPKAIFACAGAHGIDTANIPAADLPGVKDKIADYYRAMAHKFADPTITPPWQDGGKGRMMPRTPRRANGRKTFADHYAEEQCQDMLEDWQDVLLSAFTASVFDAFQIGDQPESDIRDALTAFSDAVMAWVAQGVQYNLSQYLTSEYPNYSAQYAMQYGDDSRPDTGYNGMAAQHPDAEGKKGAVMSQANHAAMGKALKQVQAGTKALVAMHKSMAPKTDPEGDDDADANLRAIGDDPKVDDEKSTKSRAGATVATTRIDSDLEAQLAAFLAEAQRDMKTLKGK